MTQPKFSTADLGFRDWSEDRYICHFLGISAGTATLLSGGLSAGANLAGGKKGASAATQAASIQAAAAQQALQLEQAKYQITQGQVQPYVDQGPDALNALTGYVGGAGSAPIDTTLPTFQPYQGGTFTPPAPFTFNPTVAQLQNVPGYQFQTQRTQDAAKATLLAQGRGTGSAQVAGVTDLANQFANANWKDYYNAALQTYNTNFNAAQNTFTTNFNAGQQGYQTNVNALLAGRTMNLQQKAQIANMLKMPVDYAMQGINTQAGLTASLVPQMASQITGAGAAQASGVVGSANALTGSLSNLGTLATNTAQNYINQQNYSQLLALAQGSNPNFNAGGVPVGSDPAPAGTSQV